MQHVRVLVIGGTGFIGRHLVARLVNVGKRVTVVTRKRSRARDLIPLPTVDVVQGDVHDDATLDRLVRGHDAVINLVGILHGDRGQPYGKAFERAHVTLPGRIADACRRHDVRRLIHMSALGADPKGASMYLRSKGDGEAAVHRVFDNWPEGALTVVRPSVVFGPEDSFLNTFASLARWFPVLPVAAASARLQPVYVGDVVMAITHALDEPRTVGKSYPLVGPQIYTLRDLVSLAAHWSGRSRPVIALPNGLARIQARLFEALPGDPLLSRDNLDSLSADAVHTSSLPELLPPELGVSPTPLESIAPGYLSAQHAINRFDAIRRDQDRHNKTH